MKILFSLALVPALMLAGCGKSDSTPGATATPVAAAPAPAGTSWSETIAATPEGHFVMGNPNAAIKLVEYGSYTCSHCAAFSAEASEEIRKIVDTGKMSFEFRAYVRDPIDISAALLARCGGKDVVYPMSEQFFGNQNAMFEKVQALGDQQYQALMGAPAQTRLVGLGQAVGLIDFARQRGIAEDQAKACLADGKTADALVKGVETANSQYQITGTPSFLINNVLVDNTANWPTLQAKLREAGI